MADKLDFVFKKTLNRTYSSNVKNWFEELPAGTIRLRADAIYTEEIPLTPPANTTAVVQKFSKQALFKDNTVANNRGWYFDYPAGYRITDLITPNYGNGYTVRVYDGDYKEIPTTDPSGWIFDYENAYLAFDNNPASYGWNANAFYVDVYRYIGKTLYDFLLSYHADLATKIDNSKIGLAGGVAPLNADGIIPPQYMPPLAITDVFVVHNLAEMLDIPAQKGDIAIRTDIRTNFILTQEPASVEGNWQQLLIPDFSDSNNINYTTPENTILRTVRDALDSLIYKSPTVTSFTANPSVIQTGSVATNVQFSWTLNKTNITNQILTYTNPSSGGAVSVTLTSNIRSYNWIEKAVDNNAIFSLTVQDGLNSIVKTLTIPKLSKIYAGTSSSPVIDGVAVLGFANKSYLSTLIGYEAIFDCSNGRYIFICFPITAGQPEKIFVNGHLNSAWNYLQLNVTNEVGYSEDYYVMRSQYKQYGNNIKVRFEA